MKKLSVLLNLLILLTTLAYGEDQYKFDLSETEKKPYHFGGYVEFKPIIFWPNTNAAQYKLNYYKRDPGGNTEEYDAKLQLEGSYEKEAARLYFKTNTDYKNSYFGESQRSTFYEGYLSLKPSASLKVDAGKRTFKWGKGYAWNPVAFIDRPKDPNDPELALEGYIVVSADYIKSFEGPLKTISFTPVLFPVYDHINDSFGQSGYPNFAGKLYFLFYDTDIDLIIFTGGSKTTRYGLDFSRNMTTNLEVHGEFAYIRDYQKNFIDSNGNSYLSEYNARSYLLGIRYLTAIYTTYILEYYHNAPGFTQGEMKNYDSFINTGYQSYLSTGNDTQLQKAANLTTYQMPNPMSNYLYLRVSQQEPFDILYFTPAITGIWNVDDKSMTISPEVLYTRFTNWELRLKATFLIGVTYSEFGEKQNDYRLEFRVGHYF